MPTIPGTGGSKMPGAGSSQMPFVSSEQTGTGASQNVAHGLGQTPSKVQAVLTGGPAAYAQPTIAYGAHDATNAVLTVTSGWKYVVIAWP